MTTPLVLVLFIQPCFSQITTPESVRKGHQDEFREKGGTNAVTHQKHLKSPASDQPDKKVMNSPKPIGGHRNQNQGK